MEIVIVDNMSDDGSQNLLKEYHESGIIKLIRSKCSRGLGRQLAFQNSSGRYIISNVDTDDIYRGSFRELLSFYRLKCEGKVMAAISSRGDWVQNVTVSTRSTIEQVGGWRDLQYAEDWDLWSRAAKAGKYAWSVFPIAERHSHRMSMGGLVQRLRYRYGRYRDEMRLGRNVFRDETKITPYQWFVKCLAQITLPFYQSYSDSFNRTFCCDDPQYFIE
jgi:glycosyltransferase involved in cell wall biosynthesis